MTPHVWKFFRAGGFEQVRIESGADLMALGELDQKLWATLSCPTRGLELDAKTLDLIDTDQDGHIRVPELLEALSWAGGVLKNPDHLLEGAEALKLERISEVTDEGKRLVASARQLLADLGKPDATAVTLDDVTDTARIFAQTRFNGDGILPAESTGSPELSEVVRSILEVVEPKTDRSGKPGVSREGVAHFFTELQAFSDWWKQSEEDATILPLGETTAAAVQSWEAVRAKVDDYFARCRLAAFDGRAKEAMNRSEDFYAGLAAKVLATTSPEIAELPLAQVHAARPLPLKVGLNPSWVRPMATFVERALRPLVADKDDDALTEADWDGVCEKLSPHLAWRGRIQGASVEKLGVERARALLGSTAKADLEALIVEDERLEPEASAIAAVEKLVRFHRDLIRLVSNYVAFSDFYLARRKGVFQAGTLYLDRRSCELCIRVEDVTRHSASAGESHACLAYCNLTRKGSSETMSIVAAFTDGESDGVRVGRNGIFYDRAGRDWDATVVKVLENPIGIRQAFWSPYRKLANLVETQIEKFATAGEKSIESAAAARVDAAAKSVESGKPVDKKDAFDVAKFAGVFAAIGLAIGAIGGALATFMTAFSHLAGWQMILAVVGLVAVISGPSVIIAWLKLRKRNLGPLLNANGWAINTHAKINVPFGRALTAVAKLPVSVRRERFDPYAERHWGRRAALAFAAVVLLLGGAWHFGLLRRWAPPLPAQARGMTAERKAETHAARGSPSSPAAAARPSTGATLKALSSLPRAAPQGRVISAGSTRTAPAKK